jgi:hypothetical protein
MGGIFSEIANVFEKMIKEQSVPPAYGRLPSSNVFVPDTDAPIEANRAYVQIILTHMHIVNTRELWTKYTPCVHVYPRYFYRDGFIETPIVVGPNKQLLANEKNVDKMLPLNKPVLGPVPYVGSPFSLSIALLRVPTENYAAKLFTFMDTVSTSIPNQELKLANGVLRALESSLANFLDLGVCLRTGVEDTYACPGPDNPTNPLRSGHYVLIAPGEAGAKEIDISKLILRDKGLFISESGKETALVERDYLVMRIEKVSTRSDWREFDALREAYDKALKSGVNGSDVQFDADYKDFQKALAGCVDIVLEDAKNLKKTLNAELKERRELAKGDDSGIVKVKTVDTDAVHKLVAGDPASGGCVDQRLAGLQEVEDFRRR